MKKLGGWMTLVLLAAATAHGQDAKTLAARANQAYQAEEARQKAGFCKDQGTTVGINNCLTAEMQRTKANYLVLVRALGALLRLPPSGQKPAGKPQRMEFDEAESAWVTYRDKTCSTLSNTYEGGTMAGPAYGGCILQTTGNHMRELHSIFVDLLQ